MAIPGIALTIRQEKFCRLMAIAGSSPNIIAAEQECGMSEGAGSRLLETSADAFFYLQELRASLPQSALDLRERVVSELEIIAFANVADYLDHDGNTLIITAMSDLPKHLMAAVSEIHVVDTASGPVIKLKFHSKLDAIDRLSKIGGYYQDKRSVNITQNYVLRAPEVAKDSKKWLEMQAETARLSATPLLEDGSPA